MGGKVVTPEASTNITLEYDGTNWTSGGNLGTARYSATGAGTQTVGITFGGNTASGAVANTENYDGSSFSTGVSLGSAIQ